MKKFIMSAFLFCLVLYSFTVDVEKASAYYECSTNETRCVDAKLTYGGGQYVASPSIYFAKGEVVSYSWENDAPGIQHVAFWIEKDGTKVGSTLYAARNASDFNNYTIQTSGYYYLIGACAGGDDNRCSGGGRLSKW